MNKKRGGKIVQALKLPGEVILSEPCIKLVGNGEITIENYNGIIDYNDKFVSFTTKMGIVEIKGEDFFIKSITDEDVSLSGKVCMLEIKEM